MRYRQLLAIVAAFLSAMIGGCALLMSTPEDKINAAIPVSEETLRAKSALLEQLSSGERKEIENEFKVRIRARALMCAKGFSPSGYTSGDEIRNKLSDRGCFVDADAEIARWLRLRRAGIILAKPPLRPLPSKAPAYLTAEEPIHNARFAENSGIALLELRKTLQVVELETGKIIYREAKTSPHPHPGFLSPNGRLFTWGDGEGRVKICESETGSIVGEIPWTHVQNFHWLDSRYAIYSRKDAGRALLIDFASGKEIPVAGVLGPVQRVVRVPASDNQYVVVTNRAMIKIEIVSDNRETETKLIQEKANEKGISPHTWTFDTSGPTADGSRYFHGRGDLTITSLATLEQLQISFEPCSIMMASATADPDKILISALLKNMSGHGSGPFYLYSIGSRTVVPIDHTKLSGARFLYIPSLRRLATIKEATITMIGELPLRDPLPPGDYPGEAIIAAIRGRLGKVIPKLIPSRHAPAGLLALPAMDPPLAELAKDAQIEAIGVYEGWAPTPRAFRDQTPRPVEVRVRRSAQPIILVLSSYEPVRWMIITEERSKLAAVLVSGYHQSQVVGAGSARIVNIGSAYAYKQDGSQHHALDSEVYQYTGKRINLFQGRYTGKEFSVGG